jgi:hypothetical protein
MPGKGYRLRELAILKLLRIIRYDSCSSVTPTASSEKRVRPLNLTIYRYVPGFDEIVSSIYGWILVWFSDALGSG